MCLAERAIDELEKIRRTATGRQRETLDAILSRLRGSVDDRDYVDVRLPAPAQTER